MDAITLLKLDHKLVEAQFKKFEKTGPAAHAAQRPNRGAIRRSTRRVRIRSTHRCPAGRTATDPSTHGGAMPQQAWNAKRERQYEHIKDGLVERGRDEDTAEEIAARTVNKERARAGEARTSSPTSIDDLSSGRRGGLRSHKGPGGRTKAQLYNEARRKGVRGRSKMTRAELERAVEA